MYKISSDMTSAHMHTYGLFRLLFGNGHAFSCLFLLEHVQADLYCAAASPGIKLLLAYQVNVCDRTTTTTTTTTTTVSRRTAMPSARSLVGPARRGWTPEEVARYELAMYRGLSSDKNKEGAARLPAEGAHCGDSASQAAPGPGGVAACRQHQHPGNDFDGSWRALVGLVWTAARRRHGAPCAAAEVRGAAAQERVQAAAQVAREALLCSGS